MHCTYREGQSLSVAVGGILLVKHIIERGNLPVLVGDLLRVQKDIQVGAAEGVLIPRRTHDGELNIGGSVLRAPLVDVFHPLLVIIEAVRRNANEFHIALFEVGRPEFWYVFSLKTIYR